MTGIVLGVGIDLVDVERFRISIERTPTLAVRLFSDAERAYAEESRDPALRLAARFAAKEAVMKAMGVGLGSLRFRDVEVIRDPGGRPSLVLVGSAAAVAERCGVGAWQLSLTHTALSAGAVAVALS